MDDGRSLRDGPSSSTEPVPVSALRASIPNAGDLATRCKQASGPDQELDLEIEVAIGGYVLGKAPPDYDGLNASEIYIPAGGVPFGFTYPPKGAIGRYYHVRRIPYTASLDAAMKLVPKGWSFGAGMDDIIPGPEGWAWVSSDDDTDIARATTPALALCAAALLASAGEAGTAETRSVSVHEHAVPQADAQTIPPPSRRKRAR
jgi:hypothetical protein